jgi:hypothetical protein
MVWLMFRKDNVDYFWKYIKPDLPCNKGEINISFLRFLLTIGWKKD